MRERTKLPSDVAGNDTSDNVISNRISDRRTDGERDRETDTHEGSVDTINRKPGHNEEDIRDTEREPLRTQQRGYPLQRAIVIP